MKPDAYKLYAVGIVFGDAIPVVAKTCQANVVVAVVNRQLAVVPLWGEEFAVHAARFETSFKALYQGEVTYVTFEEWNCRFPGSRQRDHEVARQELGSAVPPTFEAICRRRSFNKVEKLLKREDFDPRCITGATDWWNVIFGPWFLSIANALKSCFNYQSAVFYATSTTSDQLGQWFDRSHQGGGRAMCGDDQIGLVVDPEVGVVYLEGDGSRHDSHMHQRFWELKWRLYVWVVGGLLNIPKSILNVVQKGQELTMSSAGFGVEYWHPYRVRSGDCDTSLGNTLCTDFVADSCQRVFTEARTSGGTLAQAAEKVEAFCRSQLGYSLKLKVTRDVSDVTFLSGLFLPVGGRSYWAPMPGRTMAKIGWMIKQPGRVSRFVDLACTINSFAAYKFVPFLRCYLRRVMELLPEQYRHERDHKLHDHKVRGGYTPSQPEVDTWAFFKARYDLDVQDEDLFQVSLLRANQLPFMLVSEIFSRLVDRDVGR